MADIKTANLAKLVSKQAGRAKEKVRPFETHVKTTGLPRGLEKGTTCAMHNIGAAAAYAVFQTRLAPTPTISGSKGGSDL